jgi:hypothetical protein
MGCQFDDACSLMTAWFAEVALHAVATRLPEEDTASVWSYHMTLEVENQ